jgi:hypothetical protein
LARRNGDHQFGLALLFAVVTRERTKEGQVRPPCDAPNFACLNQAGKNAGFIGAQPHHLLDRPVADNGNAVHVLAG